MKKISGLGTAILRPVYGLDRNIRMADENTINSLTHKAYKTQMPRESIVSSFFKSASIMGKAAKRILNE